jgi:hypothetical protein
MKGMRRLYATGSSTSLTSVGVRGEFPPNILLLPGCGGNHTPPAPPALQTPPEKNESCGRDEK